jgi:antitoxin CptB
MSVPEARETRLKRLSMRSWRRGTREMDLILGLYADSLLAGMSEAELDLYEALLAENDQDLYPWVTGAAQPPERFAALLADIARFSLSRPRTP